MRGALAYIAGVADVALQEFKLFISKTDDGSNDGELKSSLERKRQEVFKLIPDVRFEIQEIRWKIRRKIWGKFVRPSVRLSFVRRPFVVRPSVRPSVRKFGEKFGPAEFRKFRRNLRGISLDKLAENS